MDYSKLYEKLTNTYEPSELIEKQKYIEIKYNKKQKYKILKDIFQECLSAYDEVLENVTNSEELAEYNFVYSTSLEILCILVERQTVTMNTIIEMVIERTDLNQAIKIAEVVQIGYNYGLWELSKDRYTRLHNKWEIPEEIQRILKEFRFVNPMIVKPLPVNQKLNNRGSGYLTIGADSLLMGGNYHTKDICTNVLDTMNSTQFEVNIDLMKSYRNSWSSMNEPKKADGIGKMKDETQEEYKKRIQAFEEFEKLVFKTVAELYHSGNQFYLTHKYDKRGRLYCVGYQIGYQSNSYGKAILNFKNKQTVTDEINFFEE